MKLLNSPTSIETIARIQDIQANRVTYSLTQEKANQISSGLLEIANARIGVKTVKYHLQLVLKGLST